MHTKGTSFYINTHETKLILTNPYVLKYPNKGGINDIYLIIFLIHVLFYPSKGIIFMKKVHGIFIEIHGPFMPCKLMIYFFSMQKNWGNSNYQLVRGKQESYI